jgi:HEAT repeat protein
MGLIRKTQQSVAREPEQRQIARDCDGLLLSLQSADPVVRRWAARDLVECRQYTGALVQQLLQEEDGSVREVMVTTLARIGSPEAMAGLVQCLRSDHVALRNEAIEAMKALPEAMAPIMHDLLHDDDAKTRTLAVNVLESLRHPDVETWLIGVIEQDGDVNVCSAAVDLLVEIGSSAARDALEQLKQRFSDVPYIQFAADLALKRITEN